MALTCLAIPNTPSPKPKRKQQIWFCKYWTRINFVLGQMMQLIPYSKWKLSGILEISNQCIHLYSHKMLTNSYLMCFLSPSIQKLDDTSRENRTTQGHWELHRPIAGFANKTDCLLLSFSMRNPSEGLAHGRQCPGTELQGHSLWFLWVLHHWTASSISAIKGAV